MGWPYRHIIIVSAAEQAAANVIAAEIDPDDGSGTFGVPLSADGSEPATHFGCFTASDDVMAGAMFNVDAVDPPLLASVKWWRIDAASGLLIDGNTIDGEAGQAWTWQDALQALSLSVIEPEG